MNDSARSTERAERRDAILRAAVETFAEQGFLASRTRDIAAAAGVAEGTIYLYFEGKDDLLLTAFREKVHEFCESVGSLLAEELPFAERLRRFVHAQLASIEAEPALATVLLFESRQTAQFYGGAVREVLRTYAAAVDSLLQSGVDRGEIRTDVDVPLARRMIIGALEEVELGWLLGDRTRPLATQAAPLAAMLSGGLAADPTRGS